MVVDPAGQIQRWNRAAETLSKLVDDLLDSVRARPGKLRVNAQPYDLADVAAAAVQAFRLPSEAKQLTIREELARSVIVRCDATRIQQVIFEPYRQHGGAKGGGRGLGPAIARPLVELHGGRISAHSEGPGRGATFTIRLPLLTATQRAADGQPAAVRR